MILSLLTDAALHEDLAVFMQQQTRYFPSSHSYGAVCSVPVAAGGTLGSCRGGGSMIAHDLITAYKVAAEADNYDWIEEALEPLWDLVTLSLPDDTCATLPEGTILRMCADMSIVSSVDDGDGTEANYAAHASLAAAIRALQYEA